MTTIVVVNENAAGATRRMIGQELVLVGAGANPKHVIVRRHGARERDAFGLPTAWLDFPTPETPRRPLRSCRSILGVSGLAPTIPTTTTKNGVTSCAFCGCVVDIEYMEGNDD